MSKKKLLLTAILIGIGLLLAACGRTDFKNGQNYYCPGNSFLDIIQYSPELQVRFTCVDENQKFEVIFSGPNDSNLIRILRNKNEVVYGMGVILQDNLVAQIYETIGKKIIIRWP